MSENSAEKPATLRLKIPPPARPTQEDNTEPKRIRLVINGLATPPPVPLTVPVIDPPLKKRKRVPVSPVAGSADESDAPVQQTGMLGGNAPIIITEDGTPVRDPGPPTKRRKVDRSNAGQDDPEPRSNIALLTHAAQSEEDLRSDYLFQALRQIRTNNIFASLLASTTNGAPDDWAALAKEQEALPEEQRSLTPDLCQLLGMVDRSAGIVVIDRSGFPGFDGTEPPAMYASQTHTIELAENTNRNLPAPANEAGGYWQYLSRTVFEMCNATQRKAFSAIYAAAGNGRLDCLSYALAMELMENQTEQRHVAYWKKAVMNDDCLMVLDENSGEERRLKVTKKIREMGYKAESNLERLGEAISSGHVIGYVQGWKALYAKAFATQSPDLDGEVTAWSEGRRRRAPNIDHVTVINQLTGLAVDPKMVVPMQTHIQAWYATPDDFIPNRSDPYKKPQPKRRVQRKAPLQAIPVAETADDATNDPGPRIVPSIEIEPEIIETMTTTEPGPSPESEPESEKKVASVRKKPTKPFIKKKRK